MPATVTPQSTPATVPAARQFIFTEEFAAALAIKPQSLRKHYMQRGSYFGIRPVKLPNRRLAWPVDAVAQLMAAAA